MLMGGLFLNEGIYYERINQIVNPREDVEIVVDNMTFILFLCNFMKKNNMISDDYYDLFYKNFDMNGNQLRLNGSSMAITSDMFNEKGINFLDRYYKKMKIEFERDGHIDFNRYFY